MKHLVTITALASALGFAPPAAPQDDSVSSDADFAYFFLGQIVPVGFSFCPSDMTPANGGLLLVQDNLTLYSIYGKTFGGDGITTFGLPDMRGRMPTHHGSGGGWLFRNRFGRPEGDQNVTLEPRHLFPHTHAFLAAAQGPNSPSIDDSSLATFGGSAYAAPGSELNVTMNTQMVRTAGDGGPIDIRHPFLALNYCVVIDGEYPQFH